MGDFRCWGCAEESSWGDDSNPAGLSVWWPGQGGLHFFGGRHFWDGNRICELFDLIFLSQPSEPSCEMMLMGCLGRSCSLPRQCSSSQLDCPLSCHRTIWFVRRSSVCKRPWLLAANACTCCCNMGILVKHWRCKAKNFTLQSSLAVMSVWTSFSQSTWHVLATTSGARAARDAIASGAKREGGRFVFLIFFECKIRLALLLELLNQLFWVLRKCT